MQKPENYQSNTNGTLLLNPVMRRLYEIRDTYKVGGRSRLHVYDLDSLSPLTQISLPYSLEASDFGFSEVPYAHDQDRGRLFFPYYNQNLSGLAAGAAAGLAGVVIVDEATGRITDQQAPAAFVATGLGWPVGAWWSDHEDRLYIIGRTVLPKPTGSDLERNAVQEGGVGGLPTTVIIRWNPDKPADQVATDPLGYTDSVRPVRACRRGLPNELNFSKFQASIFSSPSEPSIWVACSTQTLGFQVVRLDRNQLSDTQGLEEVYPGPERIRSTFVDPKAERLIARYVSGGEVWWVFDFKRRAWVGRIGATTLATSEVAAGLDTSTGRIYMHYTDTGLLRADARRQEVPQADRFPDIQRTAVGVPIVVDPATRRLFLRAAPDRYNIYLDEPPLPEPPADDPDARTTDVEEAEGETGVGYSAVARSYGARLILLGGAFGIVPPDQFGTTRGLLIDTGTSCGPREREIAIGLVEESALDSSQSSARAHAVRTDDATKQDLSSPSRCDLNPAGPLRPPIAGNYYPGMQRVPDPGLPPQAEPGEQSNTARYLDRTGNQRIDPDTLFVSVDCSGNKGKRSIAPRQPTTGMIAPLGDAPVHHLEAEVECLQAKETTTARGGGPAIEFAPSGLPAVKVARAFSQTAMFRDPRRGAVSQSYALARGITIGDTPTGPLVGIEAVETWAESSANGRKKNDAREDTATARFIRRIAGATVRNISGEIVFTCEDCSRDLLAFQQNVNQALAGRAEIRLPMPDARLIAGTPGGYQSAVQKDALQIRADTALNNDPSFQVPGLEIVSINDDPSLRARQIVQLAGVASATSYGIYQIGAFGFTSQDGDPPASLPAGTEVLSSADAGTTVFESSPSGPPPVLGAASAPNGSVPARIVRRIVAATGFFVRRPREALLAACVWLALVAPLLAFWRRRELVRSLTEV